MTPILQIIARLALVAAVGVLPVTRAWADDRPDPWNRVGFSEAVQRHWSEHADLNRNRGVDRTFDPATPVAVDIVAQVIAAAWPSKTVVLFYSQTPQALEVWALDRSGIRAHGRVPVTEAEASARLRAVTVSLGVPGRIAVRSPRTRSAEPLDTTPAARSGADAIPAASKLLFPKEVSQVVRDAEHLVVVPTHAIGTVPLALLTLPGTTQRLIDRATILIAPSLFALGTFAPPWTGEFREPIVAGDPEFAKDPDWVLPPLPGARTEAEVIGRQFGVAPLLGSQVTKQALSAGIERADLLFLATHAVASGEDPMRRSFLALAGPPGDTSRWTAGEIMTTKLVATTVVLSACQTGLGGVLQAGVIGVARAFQLAGVPRVVMSLWSVDDSATRELMTGFAQHMTKHRPEAALRAAMLELATTRPDPAEWAAFTVFGAPETLPMDQRLPLTDGDATLLPGFRVALLDMHSGHLSRDGKVETGHEYEVVLTAGQEATAPDPSWSFYAWLINSQGRVVQLSFWELGIVPTTLHDGPDVRFWRLRPKTGRDGPVGIRVTGPDTWDTIVVFGGPRCQSERNLKGGTGSLATLVTRVTLACGRVREPSKKSGAWWLDRLTIQTWPGVSQR